MGELLLKIVFIGIGATAVMDIWAILMRRSFGIQGLDYSMVGRWIGHLLRGQLWHMNIWQSDKIRGERALGWFFHYAIGVSFSGLLIFIYGNERVSSPSLMPALAVGVGTVLAPFLILQPGLGAGLFARKTPAPNIFRLKSLMAHTIYGIGLYFSAKLLEVLS